MKGLKALFSGAIKRPHLSLLISYVDSTLLLGQASVPCCLTSLSAGSREGRLQERASVSVTLHSPAWTWAFLWGQWQSCGVIFPRETDVSDRLQWVMHSFIHSFTLPFLKCLVNICHRPDPIARVVNLSWATQVWLWPHGIYNLPISLF